jgi:hypothetical protein
VPHTKQRLHEVGYFAELMSSNEEINQSIRPLLKLSLFTLALPPLRTRFDYRITCTWSEPLLQIPIVW